jgi:predicted phage-related endonuclease
MIMEKKVLTQEEKDQISSLRNTQTDAIATLGQIEYQIFILEKNKKQIHQTLNEIESQSQNLAEDLTKKYGDGVIDIETGEFTPK